MNWLFFALLAVVTGATREIIAKKVLSREHTLEYLVVRSFFSIGILLPLLFLVDFNIAAEGYFLMGLVAIAISYGIMLQRKALKHNDISIVDPLMNLSPLLVLVFAFLLMGEKVTTAQLGGIVLLAAGTYILELDHKHKGILAPFKKLFETKYTIMVLAAVVIFSITNTLDRFALMKYTDAFSYTVVLWLMISICFIAWHGAEYRFRNIGNVFRQEGARIFWPALLNLLMIGFFYMSLELAASAGMVVAIFRTRTLITTIEGGKLFHESRLFQKSIACAIMVSGAILVVA